jgi:hypothetical protein
MKYFLLIAALATVIGLTPATGASTGTGCCGSGCCGAQKAYCKIAH